MRKEAKAADIKAFQQLHLHHLPRKETAMKSVFEKMGGTYRREGDYLIPNLELPDTEHYQIGKYGHLRQTYLREYRPSLYNNLILSGTLYRHLPKLTRPATSVWICSSGRWPSARA